jgi:anthranilate phosphoribosyltransferase
MLRPAGDALGLVSVTHPEYLAAMREFYAAHPADTLLLRGTQGEAVANARRAQAIEWLHEGRAETAIEAEQGSVVSLPELPAIDAESTAAWTHDVLAGRRPMPAPIASQIEVIEQIATRCGAPKGIAA